MTSENVIIPVMLENRFVRMSLNIQSPLTVIWQPVATEMQMTSRVIPGKQTVKWGSQPITDYAIAKSFALGSLGFEGAEFLLVPRKADSLQVADLNPVVGAIGMDFFAKVDFELDFRNRKLNLYSQDHCLGSPVYWADRYASAPMRRGKLGNRYLPLEIEGKKIQATLSTGNALTTLTTDVTKKLYGFDENSRDIETEQDSTGAVSARYRAMAITREGLSVTNTMIRLIPRPTECTLQTRGTPDGAAQYNDCLGLEAPLHVGLEVLKELHLYFATKENVLYFTAADAEHEAGNASNVALPH